MGLSPRGCLRPTDTAPCAEAGLCQHPGSVQGQAVQAQTQLLRQARGSCPDCQRPSRAHASSSPVTRCRAAASALPLPPPPPQPGWQQRPGSPPSGATSPPPPSTHQVPLLRELGVSGLHENVSLGPALCHLLLQPVHLGQKARGAPAAPACPPPTRALQGAASTSPHRRHGIPGARQPRVLPASPPAAPAPLTQALLQRSRQGRAPSSAEQQEPGSRRAARPLCRAQDAWRARPAPGPQPGHGDRCHPATPLAVRAPRAQPAARHAAPTCGSRAKRLCQGWWGERERFTTPLCRKW